MRISDWSSDVCSSDLLIEIKAGNGGDIDVDLRNPEYDISRAIRKVLYAYRSGGDLFANLPAPVTLEAYVSPEAELPRSEEQTSELQSLMRSSYAGSCLNNKINIIYIQSTRIII